MQCFLLCLVFEFHGVMFQLEVPLQFPILFHESLSLQPVFIGNLNSRLAKTTVELVSNDGRQQQSWLATMDSMCTLTMLCLTFNSFACLSCICFLFLLCLLFRLCICLLCLVAIFSVFAFHSASLSAATFWTAACNVA